MAPFHSKYLAGKVIGRYRITMKLNILLLCNKPEQNYNANTIVDHIESFELFSRNKVWTLSTLGNLPEHLNLDAFDIVIIHYSLSLLNSHYLSDAAKLCLKNYTGLKVLFLQDEYRKINHMIDEIAYLEIDVLFTCFSTTEMERVYPKEKLPHTAKYTNLTGYIPERLLGIADLPPISQRHLHVGYRARKLPFWYGELGYEKWSIVEKWKQHTQDGGLKVDLSYHENDRIYGEKWIQFLTSCKTTLGVESGASVMDFTGELERITELYQLTHPRESFQEVQARFLKNYEGQYKLNQISPRCFEAIILKTVLVLYEGEYSGILVPNRHYIELKKDFSNINEVLQLIQDDSYLQNMADVAFSEVALNSEYSYKTFIKRVDEILEKEFQTRQHKQCSKQYTESEFNQMLKAISFKDKLFKKALFHYQRLPGNLRVIIRYIAKPSQITQQLKKKWFSICDRTPLSLRKKLSGSIKNFSIGKSKEKKDL